jgi:hypothetical protein
MAHACESVTGFFNWSADVLCALLQEMTHIAAVINTNNKASDFNPEVLVFIFAGLNFAQMHIGWNKKVWSANLV